MDDHVIMNRVRVQVRGDHYLILVSPHLPGSLDPDLMDLLRRDLTGLEALITVVGYIRSPKPEAALDSYHLLVCSVYCAVYTGDVHPPVGLIVVRRVFQNLGEIVIQIFLFRCLIRVVGVVDDGFQIALHRPEACGGHNPSSFPFWT